MKKKKREKIRGWIRKFFEELKEESVSKYEGKPFDCCHVPDDWENRKK